VKTSERDTLLVQDYADGKEIPELARSSGLGERRVRQILDEQGVERRKKSRAAPQALSQRHVALGLRLYNSRFTQRMDVTMAAAALGWSSVRLRKVERGISSVELLDLLDVAEFTGMSVEKLLEVRNGNS
jgi:hypothetical protein